MAFLYAPTQPTPRNNRIAILGPSHAANHFVSAPTPSGENPYPIASVIGPVNWACLLSGGRCVLEPEDCFGRNGEWSDAMTWNGVDYAGMLSKLPQVVASKAGHVILTSPTTNDRNEWTADCTIANMTKIIDAIVASGKLVTILLDYPRGTSTIAMRHYNTAAQPQLDYWQIVNRWYSSLHGSRGIRVIDTVAALADFTSGNGDVQASMSGDALHLGGPGAYAVGRMLAKEFVRIYPAQPVLPFASTEKSAQTGVNNNGVLSVQPYFGGTGGTLATGATGTLASNWQAQAPTSGASVVFSKVSTTAFGGKSYADADAGPVAKDWQQIVVSGTATASAEVVIMRQACNVTAGDLLRAVAEIEVDAGVTGISAITLYVFHSGSSQIVKAMGGQGGPQSTLAWPNVPVSGVIRTPRYTAQVSGNCYLQLSITTINGQTIAGTIRLRGMALGKGL